MTTVYVYVWGNNPRRALLKGRRCVIEARGRSTVLLRFLGSGDRVTSSVRALRRCGAVPAAVSAPLAASEPPAGLAEAR